jgi:hypothetical protein
MMAMRRRNLYQIMSAVAWVTTATAVTKVLSACIATAANDDE